MKGDNGSLKYILQQLNDIGERNEDNAMKYMSEKVKEVRGTEGETVVQYLMEKLKEILVWLHHLCDTLLHKLDEILSQWMRNATPRDWIILVAVAFVVGLVVTLIARECCCCCRPRPRVYRMMTAPGRNLRIPRAPFERNPAAYFRRLRAKAPLDPEFGPYESLA